MKTALKRIIAAVAVFGALSALCFSCAPVKVSAADAEIFSEAPKNERELVEWCLDELNTTYQIYRTGPVPAAAIQKLQALFYASAVSVGKAAYSQYEPDFEGNLVNMRTGFYFDADGDLHVTDLFASRRTSKKSKVHLVLASDEHWTTLSGRYNIGEQDVTGYSVQVAGDDIGSVRFWTYFGNTCQQQYVIFTNDNGDTFQEFGDYSMEYNLTRPATTCLEFPPNGWGAFMGYLPITDENNNTVYLRNNALPVSDSLLGSDLENVVNHINNYISENYPLSEIVVPVPEPIATLPNDEYSGLPAGWNEVNPVPLPGIDTPSLPVDGSEDFAESIDGLQFLSSFRDGLGFWARSVSWVCEQFPLAARVLLALGLLGILAFIFWRWSL